MQKIEHPAGEYCFATGIAPYSAGVVAVAGFDIVHVTLRTPLPYRAGFERIVHYLSERDRPRHALCAVELRIPAPRRATLFLSAQDPRPAIRAVTESAELPEPATLVFGELSLQELYRELYGTEGV